MKAGDIVYAADTPGVRGKLVEFLCDAIEVALGVEKTDRCSNGQVADTLFRFLDLAVVSDEQVERLRGFLAGEAEEDTE